MTSSLLSLILVFVICKWRFPDVGGIGAIQSRGLDYTFIMPLEGLLGYIPFNYFSHSRIAHTTMYDLPNLGRVEWSVVDILVRLDKVFRQEGWV